MWQFHRRRSDATSQCKVCGEPKEIHVGGHIVSHCLECWLDEQTGIVDVSGRILDLLGAGFDPVDVAIKLSLPVSTVDAILELLRYVAEVSAGQGRATATAGVLFNRVIPAIRGRFQFPRHKSVQFARLDRPVLPV